MHISSLVKLGINTDIEENGENNINYLQGSCTYCFCPLSFQDETAIIDLQGLFSKLTQNE